MKIRHITIPVPVPEEASLEQTDALVAAALYRAAAQHGAPAFPQAVVREQTYPAGPPSPIGCRTVPELLDAMRALKRWANLSFEALERRATTRGDKLPHSSIARLLVKGNDSRLPNRDLMTAFVLACGLSDEQWREWALTWSDIQAEARLSRWEQSKHTLRVTMDDGVEVDVFPILSPPGRRAREAVRALEAQFQQTAALEGLKGRVSVLAQ